MEFYRDTWAEIDLDAIQWNVSQTLRQLDPSVFLYAVVKANAYGHGDVPVAKTALEAGARGLAVALLDEAVKLRRAGIDAPLLVLGASRPEHADIAAKLNISLTVFHRDWLEQANNTAPLRVHIKCDTGMGRIGIKTKEELAEMISVIDSLPLMKWEGIFTHFATADEPDTAYFNEQLDAFQTLVDSLEKRPLFVHCANSAATLRFQGAGCNAVRLGISMYGLTPSVDITGDIPFSLQPAFSLHTRLTHVKKLQPGEKVSYGATYEATQEEWIGTLPIGYADGWIRKMSGQDVIIDGQRAPIVGRVCMDQCMIRLPKEYPVGTEVVLIGTQGSETVSMEEIAAKRETINYEIPCVITSRVPRIYKQHGQETLIHNPLLSAHF